MPDVVLNIYDVTNTDNENLNNVVQVLNNVTREINLGGVFHGAVQVFNVEWSFGYCAHGTGVYRVKPRSNSMYRYRESVPLGLTQFDKQEVDAILRSLQEKWQGADYDLFSRNCCHFCEELCQELGVQSIPGWLNRFAYGADLTVSTTSSAVAWVRLSVAQLASTLTSFSSSSYFRDSCTQFLAPSATSAAPHEPHHSPLNTTKFGIPTDASTDMVPTNAPT